MVDAALRHRNSRVRPMTPEDQEFWRIHSQRAPRPPAHGLGQRWQDVLDHWVSPDGS